MNYYRTTSGERVSKATIDRNVRIAKAQKIESQFDIYGFNFCEDCRKNSSCVRLDCSHNISVDECQKSGRSELAWDVNNITIRCRKCHQIYDKNNICSVAISR